MRPRSPPALIIRPNRERRRVEPCEKRYPGRRSKPEGVAITLRSRGCRTLSTMRPVPTAAHDAACPHPQDWFLPYQPHACVQDLAIDRPGWWVLVRPSPSLLYHRVKHTVLRPAVDVVTKDRLLFLKWFARCLTRRPKRMNVSDGRAKLTGKSASCW
ncbi:hypothetical protein BD311DRAFT_756440 [Dichomitus squalens]|uniref:Uncharacterized protein n=1 Tax=Dichomitus squalens TaxID=114155 RepID=A0A4Q9MPB6_9APHY|nr:hypothetical protein BD311DRAFT_756440 [Dichomitus squalens]